jgi:hypothetical protein
MTALAIHWFVWVSLAFAGLGGLLAATFDESFHDEFIGDDKAML